jgi:hypothetical protein
MHAAVENGAAGTGAHTCPLAQSACPRGDAGAQARAPCPHEDEGVVATPPLGVQLPPAVAGAATVAPKEPICVIWHEVVSATLLTETLHELST